jgi:hypothetical protein
MIMPTNDGLEDISAILERVKRAPEMDAVALITAE